jgi:hypothetical protein
MRFFWRFLTKSDTYKPTLKEILEFLVYAADDPDSILAPYTFSNVWPQFELAMDYSSDYHQFLQRFQEANDVMGVYNGSTGP